MDLAPLNVCGVVILGVLAGLHKEVQESLVELQTGQRRETHEQEDSVQHRHGEQLQQVKEKQRQTHEEMRKEASQASFLHVNKLSILVFLGEGVQVDDARNGSADQPGEAEQSIHAVENTKETQIVVVRFTVLQVVTLVVHQVPGNSVVGQERVSSC